MPPTTLYLKSDDVLYGTLSACEPVEMFWLGCTFDPTSEFESIRQLFEALGQAGEDGEAWEAAYEQIMAQGLYLFDPHRNVNIVEFILYLEGDQARLRHIDPE